MSLSPTERLTLDPLEQSGRRSIISWARARGISSGLLLLVLGLNGQFLVFLLLPPTFYSAPQGYLRYSMFSYLLMIVGGLLEARRKPTDLISLQLRPWSLMFAATLALMSLRSLVATGAFISTVWHTFLFGSILAIAFSGQPKASWPILNWVFIVHTWLAIAYTIPNLLNSSIISRVDWQRSLLYAVNQLMYAWPILLLSFPVQPWSGKLAAILGLPILVVINLFSGIRLLVGLTVGMYPLLALIAWWRLSSARRVARSRLSSTNRAARPHLLRLAALALSAAVVTAIILLNNNTNTAAIPAGPISDLLDRLDMAVRSFRLRWELSGTTQSLFDNARWKEARLVLAQLQPQEWFIGRGVYVTWTSAQFWGLEVRSMVHVGYADWMLRGGLLFVALMMWPLAWGIRAFLGSREPFTLAAGAVVVAWYFQMIFYGLSTHLPWALLCLCIGRCAQAVHLERANRGD